MRHTGVMTLLVDTTAVTARTDGVVRVTGADRLSYLHTLLSQDLQHAKPGTVADFLYLDAKGNALAAGQAVVRSEEIWLVTPREVAADLAAALDKFRFLLQVEAIDATDELVVASVRGPGQIDAPGARSQPMTAAPHGAGVVVRGRAGGVDAIGPGDWVSDWVSRLELPEAGAEDYEAWRISAGEPAWGNEIRPGRRAQELGLLPTHVHLRKGCYPGQESIAKIYNLGRPRRSLAVIELSEAVEPGATVEAEGKTGEITSVAPLGDGFVALALLPVDRDGNVLGRGSVVAGGVTGRVRRRVGEGLPQPGA